MDRLPGLTITVEQLIKEALEARKAAYAPYSGYQVGAALCTKTGKIYRGCNIENASYGATNCAERTALFKAISEGESAFSGIAIVGSKAGMLPREYAFPCGICRQVLSEFVTDRFYVIVAKSTTDYQLYPFNELLPYGFKGESIQ